VGARALGRNSTLFVVILNVFLSRNFNQSMLKNAYFLEKKTVKVVSTPFCLRRLGVPPPELRVVTPAYYYNVVELVSNAKCILFH